jgi:hypothetical protein
VSNTASGKFSKFISDRSGMEFPYKEMVTEWNGAKVHISEFEPKHPQLEPKPHTADPQGLRMARPDRTEPQTDPLLQPEPFIITSGSSTINVYEPSHDATVFTSTIINGFISDAEFRILISKEFPNGLLYACLVEAYGFLKGPADMIQFYEGKYKQALEGFTVEQMGRRRRDEYQSGSPRLPKTQ